MIEIDGTSYQLSYELLWVRRYDLHRAFQLNIRVIVDDKHCIYDNYALYPIGVIPTLIYSEDADRFKKLVTQALIRHHLEVKKGARP